MVDRTNFYVAAAVGASIAYIFTILATTGSFNFLYWAVFMAVFLVVTLGFEKFIEWQVGEEER